MVFAILTLLFFGFYAVVPALLNIRRDDVWGFTRSPRTTKSRES